MLGAVYQAWLDYKPRLLAFIPNTLRKRRLNFISIHYIYLLGMAILGSVIVFGIGEIAYIDALFFASGAATQSGLNTVNVNDIHTGQQIVLYLLGMLCNPIVIHSAVVFIRLYWFEKRFQHIVHEAKTLRRTKSKSRTTTWGKGDGNAIDEEERGVGGRSITVFHNSQPAGLDHMTEAKTESSESPEGAPSSADDSDTPDAKLPQIATAPGNPNAASRIPQQRSPDQHIAFLENQRNPKDSDTLRIPSPREFDQGGKPEVVRESDEEDAQSPIDGPPVQSIDRVLDHSNPPQIRNRITIDEPNIERNRNRTNAFPRLTSRTATDDVTATDFPSRAPPKRRGTFSSLVRSYSTQEKNLDPMPYLSYEATIGRNSMFVGLTEEQREELGGIEYRALKTLALILVTYFFGFHLLGVICLIPWILHTHWGSVVEQDGQGRVWWGLFTGASAFNDLGFTLTPDSMISFYNAIFPLLLMTFLIVIGNTGFPCMLRFVIWALNKMVPEGTGIWEELRFLLDHPRRCFTLLFPRGATWWLFTILVVLNGLDLMFFCILDFNDPTVTSIPPGLRVVDGLFQASSTRTAGFSVVNLADLHPAIQVSYLIMMYISVFPIAISMRRTNVYEEKSLGIYGPYDEDEKNDSQEPSYIGAHLRKQLSFDLWYIFLGMFIIAVAEGSRLQNTNEYAFSLFSVLFEIVSAYGTVGMSLGYPNTDASFSAEFNTVSKLVIIAMQIRGRHRGLPYELDRAILLPSESLTKKETLEAEKRHLRRRGSGLSGVSAVSGQPPQGPFRAETGLTTGSSTYRGASPVRTRDRRTATHASTEADIPENPASPGDSPISNVQSHQSHARTGLGNVMFNLAAPQERIQEWREEKSK